MSISVVLALLVAFLTPLTLYLLARTKKKPLYLLARTKKPLPPNLPPGSLGLPVIGQSLGLLRAMRSNTGERWLQDRVDRYGPVSKLSLFGAPTVFLTGPAANKLVFVSEALALLTEEEIVDNAMVVLVAGHDTSSVLMTFMVRHLAGDPATLAAMVQEHEEIAKNKADGEALTWEDLYNMKFTWRVALETLRMTPPIFGSFRRALEEIEFEGYCIPKGWQVFWASNVTHMDASIFREPAKFDPSRFENQAAVTPYSFVAFGGGARICAGMEFARVETLVAMHHLVRQFRWRLCCRENTFVRDPMPSPLNGLPIEIEHMQRHVLTSRQPVAA